MYLEETEKNDPTYNTYFSLYKKMENDLAKIQKEKNHENNSAVNGERNLVVEEINEEDLKNKLNNLKIYLEETDINDPTYNTYLSLYKKLENDLAKDHKNHEINHVNTQNNNRVNREVNKEQNPVVEEINEEDIKNKINSLKIYLEETEENDPGFNTYLSLYKKLENDLVKIQKVNPNRKVNQVNRQKNRQDNRQVNQVNIQNNRQVNRQDNRQDNRQLNLVNRQNNRQIDRKNNRQIYRQDNREEVEEINEEDLKNKLNNLKIYLEDTEENDPAFNTYLSLYKKLENDLNEIQKGKNHENIVSTSTPHQVLIEKKQNPFVEQKEEINMEDLKNKLNSIKIILEETKENDPTYNTYLSLYKKLDNDIKILRLKYPEKENKIMENSVNSEKNQENNQTIDHNRFHRRKKTRVSVIHSRIEVRPGKEPKKKPRRINLDNVKSFL